MEQPDDLDLITRTILSEAHNQGPLGQAAVAAVIKNRMAKYRMSGSDVVLQTNQFEPWNKPGGPNDPMKWSPDDPRYQGARRIAQAIMSGDMSDPTKGATHFANVATVRNRNGGTVGNHGWINPRNQTAQIGAHTFFAPEGRVNYNTEMATPNWQGESTGFQPFNPGAPGSAGAPGMTGASSTPGADMPSPSSTPVGQGASGPQGGQPDLQSMMRQMFGQQPKQQNAPILGRMLFGDGGLPGMMNKIPTPFGGDGAIGGMFKGLFGGGAGAGAGAGAPMALPGVGQSLMGASSAAPALASAAAPTAAAGASGLGSALASLFALI